MELRIKFGCILSIRQNRCFNQIINLRLYVAYNTLLVIQNGYIFMDCVIWEHAVAMLVEVLRYKQVGRGFDWNFSLT
jgi:ERCC4-type nuclease